MHLALLFTLALSAALKPPNVVPAIDLNRYMGKWHEIARYPNRFQRDCAADSSATYTLRPDGKITVLNACRTPEGRLKSAQGTAKVASRSGPNSRLKVTFFWPFYGDYWVLALDPEYRWVLVGGPDRKYLWVLAREASLPDDVYARILRLAADQGYDPSRLVRSRHS